MTEDTLQYPKHIAKEIGLCVNEINALKNKGCPFYGNKTCVRWVRAFLAKTTGADSLTGIEIEPQRRAA
jgi:hypothetical protein